MKKLVILFLILLLTACGRNTVSVPLIIYDFQDEYIYDFKEKIENSSKNIFEIESYDSQNSQVLQNDIIEDLVEVPLYIVNPVDRLSAYTIIEKANETDTPIIFINREPLLDDLLKSENAYYIGADPIESARMQAEIVMDVFGNDPESLNDRDLNNDNIIQAIILKGQTGQQDAELRTEYVVRELEENGYLIEILEIRVANFDKATAKNEMMSLIEEFGEQIEVVISNNDAMAIGALEALNDENYFYDVNGTGRIDRDIDKWLPVIGIDGLEETLELVDDGYIYGTVSIDTQKMARAVVALANALLNNENLDDIGFELVDGRYIWIEYQKYTTN